MHFAHPIRANKPRSLCFKIVVRNFTGTDQYIWWHAATLLFISTLMEQTYNILYILLVEHHSCYPHCFPLGRGPPLGCRAEIRTRACRTASKMGPMPNMPNFQYKTA
jgi:hypothetical protein